MPRAKVLIVFEFPPGAHEWQLRDLALGLSSEDCSRKIRFCGGFLARYRPGGLRPLRIVNGLWVHVRAFVVIICGRFDYVIVRSAPPLIQMTVAASCWIRRVRYGVWLMDAHPELEAEIWADIPVVGGLSRRLVKLNARCFSRADFVVVLDEAMRLRLVPDLPSDRVIVCPTWGESRQKAVKAATTVAGSSRMLKFVYLGNLGVAHDIKLMCRFLAICVSSEGVKVTFFGTSPQAVREVSQEMEGRGVEFESLPGIPFERLDQVLPAHDFDFGIVTLKEAFSGLLSPSKYVGYLVAGLPLICLGPSGSNAADVCDRFEAGLRWDQRALQENAADQTVSKLGDLVLRQKLRVNAALALQHFSQFDGRYLATKISSRLKD